MTSTTQFSAVVSVLKTEQARERLIGAREDGPAPTATWTPMSGVEIDLTEEEEAWLAERPEIVLGTATEYPPLVFRRADGTYDGMLVDLYDRLNRRLKNKLRLHIEDPWTLVQEKAKEGAIDGLAMGGRSPGREAIYRASNTLVSTYFSVFARSRNAVPVSRFSDLDRLRIGYKTGAGATRTLLETLPEAILKPYDSHEALTQALLRNEIDVVVAWLSYDFWRKERLQGTIDKIFLIDEYPVDLVAHVRNDWPELVPILNKAIATITREDRQRIAGKWFAVTFEREVDYTLIRKLAIGFLLVLAAVVAWAYTIRRQKLTLTQSEARLRESDLRLRILNNELIGAKEAAEAASRAKSIFLANMSHELRTPLNAVLGFSRRLAEDRNSPVDHREKLSLINRSGEHLLAMINDLLDLSKIEAGREEFRLEMFDLQAMLEEETAQMFELPAKERGLHFALHRDGDLPRYIKADRGKLRQVLMNLLSNAIKYTRRGGISLRAGDLAIPDDPAAMRLRFEVEDSGEGMAPEVQSRVFDAFYQGESAKTESVGTGLGLAITKSYVEMMDGRISVQSALGVGSTFRVDVSVAPAGCDEVVYKPFLDQEILDTMARLLGVDYRYQDSAPLAEQTPATKLTVGMLADLPPELRQDLSEASLVLDIEAIANLIRRIRALAPETAQHLHALVQEFQLDRIRELLDEARIEREALSPCAERNAKAVREHNTYPRR